MMTDLFTVALFIGVLCGGLGIGGFLLENCPPFERFICHMVEKTMLNGYHEEEYDSEEE